MNHPKRKNPAQAALLGALLCCIMLLPQILYSVSQGETHQRGFFQDPDDYTQLLTALESWETGEWWTKKTKVDGTPETGEYRPDHWSQIHRAWLVSGAVIYQKITGSTKKESLTTWAFWSNAPLLILCSALLATCFQNQQHKNPWTPAMLASFVLYLPVTRWAGNLGHPDHHLWIITATAAFGACLLTKKTVPAAIALGTIHCLSPLTFLPIALGTCLASVCKPSQENKLLLKITGATALILWLAEYWKAPQLTRLDAPNPWVPLMILGLSYTNSLRPKSIPQWATAAIICAGGITFACLAILNPQTHLTILDPKWRNVAVHERIHDPTLWIDPIYLIPILPIFLLLLPSWRKYFSKNTTAFGASISALLAAIKSIRAHESAGALIPTWLVLSKEKSLKRFLPPSLVLLCLIATIIQPPPHMRDLAKIIKDIPQGSRTLSSPVYHTAITWITENPTPISHHWECWPQNQPIYSWIEEPNPEIFLQKAKALKATHILAGTKLNGTPLTQNGKKIPIHQLALGSEIPGTKKISSQGNLHLYKITAHNQDEASKTALPPISDPK